MDRITETSPPTDEPHAEPETLERLEQLTGCHLHELTHLERERRATEAEIIHGLNRDVSVSLAGVVDGRRSRADRTHAERFIIPMYGSPLETIDLDRITLEAAPGERPARVLVPRAEAWGDLSRTAWLFADVSCEVWR